MAFPTLLVLLSYANKFEKQNASNNARTSSIILRKYLSSSDPLPVHPHSFKTQLPISYYTCETEAQPLKKK